VGLLGRIVEGFKVGSTVGAIVGIALGFTDGAVVGANDKKGTEDKKGARDGTLEGRKVGR